MKIDILPLASDPKFCYTPAWPKKGGICMKNCRCADCRFFYADDRITPYRRDPMFFCRKKGSFFSRNYAVHEQNRILPEDPACSFFKKR